MKKLSTKRVNWIIDMIGEWYAIREQSGLDRDPTRADVDHSALLWRLLSGEKALRYPPPRSFSYPNYEAAEGNEFKPMNVWFAGDIIGDNIKCEAAIDPNEPCPNTVIIDQATWEIVSREGDLFEIRCPTDPATWTLRLSLVRDTTIINQDTHQWILQRIDHD